MVVLGRQEEPLAATSMAIDVALNEWERTRDPVIAEKFWPAPLIMQLISMSQAIRVRELYN